MKKLALAVSILALAGTAAAVQRPGSQPKPTPAAEPAPAPAPAAAPAPTPVATPAKAGGLPSKRPGAAPAAEPAAAPADQAAPVTFEQPTVDFEKRKNVLVAKLTIKATFNVANSNAAITVKSKCSLNGKAVTDSKVLKAGNVVSGVDSVLSTELKGMAEKTKQCELEFGYGTGKFVRLGHYCWPGGQSERGIYDGACE
jgi:hypothetical protein